MGESAKTVCTTEACFAYVTCFLLRRMWFLWFLWCAALKNPLLLLCSMFLHETKQEILMYCTKHSLLSEYYCLISQILYHLGQIIPTGKITFFTLKIRHFYFWVIPCGRNPCKKHGFYRLTSLIFRVFLLE